MPTKEEYEIAVRIINEVAGSPESGAIAELVKDIKSVSAPAKEVRVAEPKETR